MGRRVVWAIAGLALAVVGCCRSSGPAHKCDFTPPDLPGVDGGTDGPIPCGTAICENGKVCCYKKSPAVALCIDPSQYVALACEKMDLPCWKPSDCPGGGALSCCVNFQEGEAAVSCRPPAICLGEQNYIACETEADCPLSLPCVFLAEVMGMPFSICGGLVPQ